MNKRQILSLTLALIMVFGTMSGAFASEASVTSTASQFLKQKGVLVGNEKGDLMLNDGLLRRDSVILLSRLLGQESVAKNFGSTSTWSDTTSLPSIYGSYLGWGQTNGYFVGTGSNTFGPNESLKAPEYAIVLLRALDYDVQGDSWKATLELAEKLGLLEDLSLAFEDTITRGQMSIMTFNALGTVINGTTETLAERLNITLPVIEKPEEDKAKELKVENVKTENLKEVIVELTNAEVDEKDLEKIENANNYRVNGFKVEKATKVENTVVLVLDKALVKNRSYELVLRNIVRDVNGTYKFKAEDNTAPTVEEVVVLGEYGIKVVMTEPIKGLSGRDFQVDGKNVTMGIENYGRNIILTPYHNEKFSDKASKLTIKSLEDYAGFRTPEANFDIEIIKDEEAPKVVNAVLKGNVVEVEFDKDIYKDSVSAYENRREEGNIFFEAGRVDEFATGAVKVDTNVVRYTFARELPRRATVVISGVTNHSKVAMETETIELEESYDLTEPEIIEETVKVNVEDRTATITLEFDREVDGKYAADLDEGFDKDNHVSLFEREISRRDEVLGKVKSVDYGKNKAFIVVELEDLNVNNNKGDFDYILEVRNFTDISALRNRMYADYIEFELVPEDAKFSIEDINVVENRYTTEIRIDFNNAVDLNALENEDNYLFRDKTDGRLKDVRQLDGSIFFENRGETVVIELPDFKVSDFESLLVLRTIKDLDNTRLGNDYTYTFATGSINNGQYSVAKVDGKRVVTPNAGVTKVSLQSNLKGEFVINGNLAELTINTPNADVTVAEGVTVETIKVIEIAKDSLVVNGVVNNLVVATSKTFSISGNVADIKITTTLAKTNVRVREGLEGAFATVELVKGTEKDLGTELGIEKIAEVTITVVDVEEFEVKDSKDVVVEAVEGKFSLVVGNVYTINAEGFEVKEITVEATDTAIEVELVALEEEEEGTPLIPLEPSTPIEEDEETPLTPLEPSTPVTVVEVLSATKAGEVVEFKIFDGEEEVLAVDGEYTLEVGKEYTVVEVTEEGEAVTSVFTVNANVEDEVVTYVVTQAEEVELVVEFVVVVTED